VAAMLGLGLVFLITDARAHDDGSDEGVSFRAVVTNTAAGRLLKTVEHLARKGYDVADVRQMVEETIHYGIEAETQTLPLNPGVVHDAIEATYEGERLDPREANWSYLRAQLEKLLVPPASSEEAKKQKKDQEQGWDEEDKPPESAGQSTQQSTSDSGGRGGPSKTDAHLGELKNEPPRAGVKVERPPVKIKPFADDGGESKPVAPMNGVKALALKSWRSVTKSDSPGFLHQSLQGGPQKAVDGRDY
jgi:Ca-activated chloride channel family protein